MRWLRALYVANGLAIGALYGFVPVLLQAKGFDPALVGVTTSLGSLAYTIVLPVWGHIGDEVAGPRRTLQISCVPAAVVAFGYGLPLPLLLMILCQVVLSIASGPAMALTDAMVVPTLRDPNKEYTRLRWLTSLGAALGGAGGGVVYELFGYAVAPIAYLLIIALALVSIHFVKLGMAPPHRHAPLPSTDPIDAALPDAVVPSQATSVGRGGSVGEALRLQPRLYGILASVILVFIGIMSAGTYITLRVSDLGGGALGVGLSNGIGWAAEIFGMMAVGGLIARFGARRVAVTCAVLFAACIASWAVLTDLILITVIKFLTGVIFAGLFVSFVLTIAAILPARLQSTGQTLFQAACFGFAAVVANFVGGLLYQQFGAFGVFGGGAVCTFLGALLGLVVMPSERELAEELAGQMLAAAPASVSIA